MTEPWDMKLILKLVQHMVIRQLLSMTSLVLIMPMKVETFPVLQGIRGSGSVSGLNWRRKSLYSVTILLIGIEANNCSTWHIWEFIQCPCCFVFITKSNPLLTHTARHVGKVHLNSVVKCRLLWISNQSDLFTDSRMNDNQLTIVINQQVY